MQVTVINGAQIATVNAVNGSTVGDVLDALQMDADGMQIKVDNVKKAASAPVSDNSVIVLVPNVVAG
jgi:hypothetical protein